MGRVRGVRLGFGIRRDALLVDLRRQWTVVDLGSNELAASDPRVYVLGNVVASTLFVMLGLIPLALALVRSRLSRSSLILGERPPGTCAL